MKEIWKSIEGYENLYEISNLGSIKSLKRTVIRKNGTMQTFKEKFLNPSCNSSGYKIVNLTVNKNNKCFYLHRLIAKHFIPNPDKLPEVNHINSNRSDNSLSNLEWVTKKENVTHGIIFGNNKGNNSKKVIDITNNKIYSSAKEAAKSINMNPSTLTSKLKGRRKNNTNLKYID